MQFDSHYEFFAQKLGAIQEQYPNAVVHGLLIKEVEVTNGILAHLLHEPSADVRAEIRVFGDYGNKIKRGRIVFAGERIEDCPPTFDAGSGEVLIQAPVSQIAAYVACLRSSKNMLLIYAESPAVDQVFAQICTYDQI